MKTRISKISFLLTGLSLMVIMSLFFYSCQKEEIVLVNESIDYEQIGIEHNKGLDYVFEYLKEKGVGKKSNLKSTLNILSLTEEATIEFLSNNLYVIQNDNLELAINEAKRISNIHSQSVKLKSAKLKKNIWPDEVNHLLSDTQKGLLTEIDEVLSDLKLDLQPSLRKLKAIEKKAKTICTEEERFIVLSATAVGCNSLQYWHDNYEKWMIELGSVDKLMAQRSMLKSKNKEGRWFNWKKLGKADVAGATSGAIGGTVAGGASGGLAGAGAGAAIGALGGGLAASAKEGVGQLWDHWFGNGE